MNPNIKHHPSAFLNLDKPFPINLTSRSYTTELFEITPLLKINKVHKQTAQDQFKELQNLPNPSEKTDNQSTTINGK